MHQYPVKITTGSCAGVPGVPLLAASPGVPLLAARQAVRRALVPSTASAKPWHTGLVCHCLPQGKQCVERSSRARLLRSRGTRAWCAAACRRASSASSARPEHGFCEAVAHGPGVPLLAARQAVRRALVPARLLRSRGTRAHRPLENNPFGHTVVWLSIRTDPLDNLRR